MPTVSVSGIRFYYEINGQGEPIVLIRGVGSSADHWYAQGQAFSPHFTVLTFDNRGIGRSTSSKGPYTIIDMAEDTLSLMDAVGISRAHVMGLSMGGMIAQEIALRHPERVKHLVLACTHCGGSRAVRASTEILSLFSDYIRSGSFQAGQAAQKCLFEENTLRQAPEIVQRYTEISSRFPPQPETMMRQLEAVQGHDTYDRLSQIKSPTLVITGSEDVLIPPQNSSILANQIPGARLQIIEGGGHQFLIEKPEASNQAILEFLRDDVA